VKEDMLEDNNKVLIITGGQIEDSFLQDRINQEQYHMIIAADHGLLAADRLQLSIDFILGDFDSIPEAVLKKYREISTPIQTFPTEKDKTDTQIAIELALMHNATSIDIIGATGTRLDHVLGNIHLLMLPMQLNVTASIIDSNNKIYLKRDSFVLHKDKQHGDYVSLLPFSDQVTGLTLQGFKYPLNSITLSAGNSLGISNEIVDEEATVDFIKGILVVIEARD
jgi:thiamine pyrophosphokinase